MDIKRKKTMLAKLLPAASTWACHEAQAQIRIVACNAPQATRSVEWLAASCGVFFLRTHRRSISLL